MRTALAHVECFHLVFLRHLEARLDRATWIVSKDANLRFWFASLRYSEDLDLDVVRGAPHVLRDKVDGLLASAAFREMLEVQELELQRVSKPKQTETTQRWKFELRARDAGVALHTRVEFSRRGTVEEFALDPARLEVVRPYGLQAPTANHYVASAALRQKIGALAGRRETQARDIWDVEHLLRATGADPRPLTPALREAASLAVERSLATPYAVFKAQVVGYLSPEHQGLYGTKDAWDRICELVAERLTGFLE